MAYLKTLALACLFTLTTCAQPEDRFLSLEEDQAMREQCEQGCVIVPAPLFQQIIEALKRPHGRAV